MFSRAIKILFLSLLPINNFSFSFSEIVYKLIISSSFTESTFLSEIQPHIHALSVYFLDFSAIFVGINLTVDFIFVDCVASCTLNAGLNGTLS